MNKRIAGRYIAYWSVPHETLSKCMFPKTNVMWLRNNIQSITVHRRGNVLNWCIIRRYLSTLKTNSNVLRISIIISRLFSSMKIRLSCPNKTLLSETARAFCRTIQSSVRYVTARGSAIICTSSNRVSWKRNVIARKHITRNARSTLYCVRTTAVIVYFEKYLFDVVTQPRVWVFASV